MVKLLQGVLQNTQKLKELKIMVAFYGKKFHRNKGDNNNI